MHFKKRTFSFRFLVSMLLVSIVLKSSLLQCGDVEVNPGPETKTCKLLVLREWFINFFVCSDSNWLGKLNVLLLPGSFSDYFG